MAVDPTFVDTNVLVYASVASAPWHADALACLDAAWDEARPLWVSRQVLREFAVVRSRPQTWAAPTTGAVLAARLRWIESRFEVADDTAETTERLLSLIETFDVKGLAIHDANLVATMQMVGIQWLLTHNVRDVRRYADAGLIDVLPLVADASWRRHAALRAAEVRLRHAALVGRDVTPRRGRGGRSRRGSARASSP